MENFSSLKINLASLNVGSCRIALIFDNTTIRVLPIFVTCGQRECGTTKATFIYLTKGFTQTNHQHKAGVSRQVTLGIFNLNL